MSGERAGRLIGLDARLPTLVGAGFVVIWVGAVPVSTWPSYLALVGAGLGVLAVSLVTINGFSIVEWSARLAAALLRRRPGAAAPDPTATVIDGVEIAVVWDRGQLVCALDVHGRPHLPHWLVQRRVRSTAALPLDTLEAAIEALGEGRPDNIDVVFDAVRLVPGPYSATYDAQLAGRPVSGRRSTLLIARFAPAARPLYYGARTSLKAAAAASLLRIADALAQAGCTSTPLSVTAMKDFAHATRPGRPGWRRIDTGRAPAQTDTVYSIEPAGLCDARFAELWSVRCDRLVATLHRDRAGRWSGFARIRTPNPAPEPPLPFLKSLPGQQRLGASLSRPAAVGALPKTIYGPVPALTDLHPPTGPDGQMLGMTEDGQVLLLPLAPGVGAGITAAVSAVYAEQLVMRAATTGVHVTIVTTSPARWAALAGPAVRTVSPDSELPTGSNELHVYDEGLAPPPGADTAWLRLGPPVQPAGRNHTVIEQRGETITVSTAAGRSTIRPVIDPAEVAYLPAARTQASRAPVLEAVR